MTRYQLHLMNMVLLRRLISFAGKGRWPAVKSKDQPPKNSGYSLIELLVAIGLFSVLVSVLFSGFIASRDGQPQQEQRFKASTLLQETLEAVRVVREAGWEDFAENGVFHPQSFQGSWQLASGPETIDGFTRSVTISDVYRDNDGAIASSDHKLDPSTKKIDISVSWDNPLTTLIERSIYLTRYLENLSYTETTAEDFTGQPGNESILNNTSIRNQSGGEVTLAQSAYADWCQPQDFVVNQLTLPKLSNAIHSRQGGAYLGSGDGNSGSPVFLNVDIDDPPLPASPSATIAGTFDGNYVTNSIYSDGRYVYLATSGSPQVRILDTNTNPYSQVGTVTIPGGAPANSVHLSTNGNVLFVTSGNKLYTFDVTNKNGSHTTVKSSVSMVAGIWSQPTARQVEVVGNRAYVGTGGSLLGLQTFSFNADGGNLKFVAAALLTFSQEAKGLYVDDDAHYAYVVFNNASGINFTRGLVVIDLTRTSWLLITYYPRNYTYDTGGMDPRGVAVPTNSRAIVVGESGGTTPGSEQYQVVDTSSLSSGSPSLTYCGGYPVSSGVFGVSSILDQFNTAYSYIITGEEDNQFKIIRGGEGGGGYQTSGTFESSILSTQYPSGFNKFNASLNPQGQTIRMQLASADPVNDSCNQATYNYVGPQGETNQYFVPEGDTISGTVPFGTYGDYENPARCFRYKVFFETTDSNVTPIFNDFTLNYSP